MEQVSVLKQVWFPVLNSGRYFSGTERTAQGKTLTTVISDKEAGNDVIHTASGLRDHSVDSYKVGV